MSGLIRGKIRKITIGTNPKDAIAHVVDLKKEYRGLRVVEIIQDHDYLTKYGKEKAIVICENAQKVRFIWKEVIGVAFVLEYGDPEGNPIDYI
jgi:hypothetical protein